MTEPLPTRRPRSRRATRRLVHELLSDRASQPRAAADPALVERVLARVAAAPTRPDLARASDLPRAPRAWRPAPWLAVAAGVLLVALLAQPGEREPAKSAAPPEGASSAGALARLLEREAAALALGDPEQMLEREWDAVVGDARALLTRLSRPLPR